MSISKMKKLLVVAPCDEADAVIKKLISLRCVNIVDFPSKEIYDLLERKNFDEQRMPIDSKIEKIEHVISGIAKYAKAKARLGDGRKKIDREEFVASIEYADACEALEKAYSALQALETAKDQEGTEDEINALEGEIFALAGCFEEFKMLYDIEKTNLEVVNIKGKAAYSDTCAFIFGWIPKKAQEKVETALADTLCAYEITDPDDDDEPPVRISNNPITRCFEWITSGFGTPKYSLFDATGIMSVFCFVAFGLMIHDVGYGAVLTILGFVGAAIAGLRSKAKSVLNMLGVCGISSIIFGVLFGGWFGDMPYAIMQNLLGIENAKEAVPFFNGMLSKPARDPIFYLVLCLSVGAIQILVGMIIKFFVLCHKGRAIDAFLDIFPWWVIFAGIAFVFSVNLTLGLVTIGVGALVVLIFHGRAKSSFFSRLGNGVLGLGKIALYIVDLANYLKIFVVGICVGIITHYVNLLGTIIGPAALGYVLFAVVSIIGHAISLILITFAAVVFVKSIQNEFLKYFCECGGEEFIPSEPCEKYTIDISENTKVEAV